MTTEQTQTLLAMVAVLGMFVLLVLPSVIGIVHDRRIDRQIREAQERDKVEAQKSSSRSTVPSTATWYAEGRRSKKLVSS
jgi:Na+/H+-dicarboxylate symporter